MKTLAKFAIAIPLLAMTLVVQAFGPNASSHNPAGINCGGCTNSAGLACGGCTNTTEFACGGCTNSVLLACGGGCTNSLTF